MCILCNVYNLKYSKCIHVILFLMYNVHIIIILLYTYDRILMLLRLHYISYLPTYPCRVIERNNICRRAFLIFWNLSKNDYYDFEHDKKKQVQFVPIQLVGIPQNIILYVAMNKGEKTTHRHRYNSDLTIYL